MNNLLALLRFLSYRFFCGFSIPKISYIGKGVEIHKKKGASLIFSGKLRIDDFAEITSEGYISLGNHVSINKYTRIIAKNRITIGNDVTIAQFVSILDHDHDINAILEGDFQRFNTSEIKIGNNVWIADKVTILKGVTIGDNVVIGANSVVNKDIPSNCIAAGVPCQILKQI